MARPVTALSHALLKVLSDSASHSYGALTSILQCTRSLLEKSVSELRELGVEIESSDAHGCRLGAPMELLNADRLSSVVEELGGSTVSLDVLASVDSTNSQVARARLGALPQIAFCFSEMQTRGRGTEWAVLGFPLRKKPVFFSGVQILWAPGQSVGAKSCGRRDCGRCTGIVGLPGSGSQVAE